MNQIPIKIIVSPSSVFPGYFLAKAGVKFCDVSGTSKLISGFGLNQDKDSAARSARFETLEHLYATHSFQKQNNVFYGRELKNNHALQEFASSSILIGPLPKGLGRGADANGLSCHNFYEKAVEHALAEILERHCLACLWYGDDEIIEIEGSQQFLGHFRVRNFTLEKLFIPFVVTVIDCKKEGIWALGSAIRDSILAAANHAKHEAIMLIESAIAEEGCSYSKDIEHRILSLKNKDLAKERESFIQNKISKKHDITQTQFNSVYEIAEKILGLENNIWVVDLLKTNELNVVRVLCSGAKNPRWLREKPNDVPYDPFC